MFGAIGKLLDECTSTNDIAAAWAREGAPHGATVMARAQTKGRGRMGRTWHSPPGASFYYSIILRPSLPLHKLPPLTLAVGVGPRQDSHFR